MNSRQIKFNAYIKALHIILTDVDIYANGMIGIEVDKLNEQLKLTDKYLIDDMIFQSIVPTLSDDDDEYLMVVVLGQDYVWFEEGQHQLLQYTGINDKNNNSFYEYDIVQLFDNNIPFCIIYKENIFAYILSDARGLSRSVSWVSYPDKMKIGNYLLNPELLNIDKDVTK